MTGMHKDKGTKEKYNEEWYVIGASIKSCFVEWTTSII
jgi:hypothetical protein